MSDPNPESLLPPESPPSESPPIEEPSSDELLTGEPSTDEPPTGSPSDKPLPTDELSTPESPPTGEPAPPESPPTGGPSPPEPSTGEHRCINCSTPAPGNFCPQCGQETAEPRAPFAQLVREFLDHLSIDSKLPRSLFELICRPGRLTELYLEGHRAPYIAPLRNYLFLSLVFFMLFSIESPDVSNFDVFIGDEQVAEAKSPDSKNRITLNNSDPNTWLGKQFKSLLDEQFDRFKEMDPQLLVSRLAGGIQSSLPTSLFVFLPLLALALKLLFLRSPRLYFDHLIFALHFQSFLFLALSLNWFLHNAWLYLATIFLLVPLHLLLALRRVYRQRWRWIIPKWLVLLVSYLILLVWVFAGVVLYVLKTI